MFAKTGGICQISGSALIDSYVVALVLLAIIATVENVLVLIVMCKHAVLRTPSFLMLGSLAGVDLVTGAIVTPIKAVITLNSEGDLLIPFVVLLYIVVCFSLVTVTMISIDRFCHVYFLERYNLTKKKLCIAVLLCWSWPILLIILALTVHYWVAFAMLHFFITCILTMIAACIATIITLRKLSATHHTTHENGINNEKRAVKTTLIIVGTFIIMNIPTVLSIVLVVIGKYSNNFCAVTFFVMLANSAVNPVIYCWRIPVMRKHVLKFLHIQRFTGDANPEETHDMFLTVHEEDTNI